MPDWLGCDDVYERAIGTGCRFRRRPAASDAIPHCGRSGSADASQQDDGLPAGSQRWAACSPGGAILPGARQGRPRHAGELLLRRRLAPGCGSVVTLTWRPRSVVTLTWHSPVIGYCRCEPYRPTGHFGIRRILPGRVFGLLHTVGHGGLRPPHR